MKINFTKMHGSGNDFVVVDATKQLFQMTASQIQKMANRHLGVGFDQLLVIETPKDRTVDFHFRIFNADGSEVSQCGNGACCIAQYIHTNQLMKRNKLRVSTLKNILELKIWPDDKVSVKMGVPQFDATKIPSIISNSADSYVLKLNNQKKTLSVVNIGNPHVIILVDSIDALQVSQLGSQLSNAYEYFPEGTNVGFMQIINSRNVCLRVYERGVGETLACGSGACAAMVIGRLGGFLKEKVVVNQPGGNLIVYWNGPLTPVIMTGPSNTVFCGEWLN